MIYILGNPTYGGSIYYTIEGIPKKEEFLRYFDVIENSYFGEIIERLYNFIFLGTKDLNFEFKEYYCQEYNDFKEYLEKYHYLDEIIIEKLLKDNNKKIYCTELEIKEDYGISRFLDDEISPIEIFKKITNYFE